MKKNWKKSGLKSIFDFLKILCQNISVENFWRERSIVRAYWIET